MYLASDIYLYHVYIMLYLLNTRKEQKYELCARDNL